MLDHALAELLEASGGPVEADPAMRLLLARSVSAREDVGVLDHNNSQTSRIRLAEAIDQDAAFFVTVSPFVVAFDFDSENTEDPVLAAHRVHATLLLRGQAPVMLASGRAGHRHVMCRAPRPEVAAVLRDLGLPASVRRHTIRPPLSRHRDGEGRSRLLVPRSAQEALARLDGSILPKRPSHNTRWLLRQTEIHGTNSVSERVFGIAMGAANALWTLEDFLVVTCSHSTPASQLLAARVQASGPERTLEWLTTYVWPDAARRVAENPPARPSQPHRGPQGALAWALDQPWAPRTGPTDYAVLVALIGRWARCGLDVFDMSEREICEASGISGRDTVHKSLARLVHCGRITRTALITADPRLRLRASGSWSVTVASPAPHRPTAKVFWRLVDATSHDVFRNGIGIGKSAALLYAHLVVADFASSEELSSRSGLSPRVTRRVLDDLHGLGLAEQCGGGWRAGGADLDVAAAEAGSGGRGARQHQQHRREREARDHIESRWG